MLTPRRPASVVTSARTPGRSGTGIDSSTSGPAPADRSGRFATSVRAISKKSSKGARSAATTSSRTRSSSFM